MNVLGPNGNPYVTFGGDRAWRQRVIGDIVCSFQWIHHPDIDPEAPHPCMCLYPANRRMDTGAYVIPQRNAYVYVDNRGNPTAQLLGSAFKAAATLNFDRNDRSAIHRLIDIITQGLPDLIDMPSDQDGALEVARRTVGIEARASINGRTIHEEVL